MHLVNRHLLARIRSFSHFCLPYASYNSVSPSQVHKKLEFKISDEIRDDETEASRVDFPSNRISEKIND